MKQKEITDLLILLFSWMAGQGVLYLYLKNQMKEVVFANLKSSYFLGAAIGVIAAFAGGKANISFWLVWIIFAAAGGFVTYRFLAKKDPISYARSGVYGSVSPTDKDENVLWVLIRGLFIVIFVLGVLYLTAWQQPCDVDKQFLNCRIKWTWGDIIGIPMFMYGLVVMSGIHKGLKNLMSPPNSTLWNQITFAGMVLAWILFWFA